VSGSEVDEGKAILVPPWTDAFAIANVHANRVESVFRTGEKAAMSVASDGGHVANGKGGIAFVIDV
jgi:hypothetical protein